MISKIAIHKSSPNTWTFWAVSLGIIGMVVRLASIHAPLISDELTSASIWAQMPYGKILTNYQFPNNHIFHSLLISLILKNFGAEPAWLRIPAFLSGIISLFLVYKITLKITKNHFIAYGALTLLGTATAPIYYSINARGHSLLMLFFLLSFQILLPLFQSFQKHITKEPIKFSWKTIWKLIGLCALATWTVPIFIFFEGALFVIFTVLILSSPSKKSEPLLKGLTGLLIALIIFYIQYFMIISPEMLTAAKANAAAVSSTNFFSELLSEWTQPWDECGFLFILLALLGIGAIAIIDRIQAAVFAGLLFLPLIIAWSAPFLGLINQIPQPRVFLFLLPLFYICVAHGVWHAFELIQNIWVTRINSEWDCTTIQKFSFGTIFFILIAWSVQDLVVHVLPQRQSREDYQKVQKFLSKLGPRDLILTSNRQHIWFYLYGANQMRKRVERILDDGQLDNIYLLANLHGNNRQDVQWITTSYGRSLWLKNYSSITSGSQPAQKLLIPEEILENMGQVGSFNFFRVKSRAVYPLVKLQSPLDSTRWGTHNIPDRRINMLRKGPRKTFAFKFQKSFFIFDKQPLPPQKALFSVDLFIVRTQIPKSAWVLYSNAHLEGPQVVFNPTWSANNLVMDHPYGPFIFQRPWISHISLSHPNPFQPILAVKMMEINQEGKVSGMVAYRIQGLS